MSTHRTCCRNRIHTVCIIFVMYLMAGDLWSATCSRDDIDYYLQRGFSQAQIVRLCGNAPAVESTPKFHDARDVRNEDAPTGADAVESPPPELTASKSAPADEANDIGFLKASIAADVIDVTPRSIRYTIDGCFPYGDEDDIEFRKTACVVMKTTIQRKGMGVVSAVKPIFLLRDAELIVKGEIKREITKLDQLKPNLQKVFLQEYPLAPVTVDIPTHKGINPVQVGEVIARFAR